MSSMGGVTRGTMPLTVSRHGATHAAGTGATSAPVPACMRRAHRGISPLQYKTRGPKALLSPIYMKSGWCHADFPLFMIP